MSSHPRRVALGVVGTIVVADQLSKNAILNHVDADDRIHVIGPLHLVRRFNTGGAFSVGDGHGAFPWIVSFLVAVLTVWFISALHRQDPRLRGWSLVALSSMLGGALGNQIDRLFRGEGWNRGAVVDFFATGFWPVFNLADTALFCGAFAIAAMAIFGASQKNVTPS